MNFDYDPEQQEFRASLRRMLGERAPLSRVREIGAADDIDREVWALLRDQMGIPSLHVPEEYGGGGFSLEEISLVVQELGRALTPVPVVSTIGAIEAFLASGVQACRESQAFQGLVEGSRLGALALSDPAVTAPQSCPLRWDGTSLNGRIPHVVHGGVADLVVLPAVVPETGEVDLFVVETSAPGVVVERAGYNYDPTTPVATIVLDSAPATRLQVDPRGLSRVLAVQRILVANEAVGAAEAACEMAVDYAKTRVQFNRPIGSFQAIKHKCADMAIALDGTRAVVMYATMVAASGGDDVVEAALTAKHQAADALTLCAEQNIQVHGGIGFTDEADPHLYFRRARVLAPYLGDRSRLLGELADLVGI